MYRGWNAQRPRPVWFRFVCRDIFRSHPFVPIDDYRFARALDPCLKQTAPTSTNSLKPRGVTAAAASGLHVENAPLRGTNLYLDLLLIARVVSVTSETIACRVNASLLIILSISNAIGHFPTFVTNAVLVCVEWKYVRRILKICRDLIISVLTQGLSAI